MNIYLGSINCLERQQIKSVVTFRTHIITKMVHFLSYVLLLVCFSTYAEFKINQANDYVDSRTTDNNQSNSSEKSELGLVMVVNASNSITMLSKKEVIDIYMGRFKTFPNDTSVTPIDFPEESEQKQLFYKLLVNKNELKIKAYWSRLLFSGRATPPIQASSKKQVIAKLVNNPNGLAYIQEQDVTSEMKIVYRL